MMIKEQVKTHHLMSYGIVQSTISGRLLAMAAAVAL